MSLRRFLASFVPAALAALLMLANATALGAPRAQRHFGTPKAAAEALYQAVRAGDDTAVSAILGPGSDDVVHAGDEGEDIAARARFAAAFEESMRMEKRGARTVDLHIGAHDWRFPFPLVRDYRGWRFDTLAGRDEVIARRVGRNELAAIRAALASVDAQREYALEPHDGVGPGVYARRIASTAGRHDGLYWTPTRLDPLSPLGVMYSRAAIDEVGEADASAYHGYFFRVLLGQGPAAEGGAADYLVGGRMIGGFALVAYPARYRVSGVRTFIVNHRGVVYSRDLGPRTGALAHAMRRFDPGPGWRAEREMAIRHVEAERLERFAADSGCTFCHREGAAPRDGRAPLAPSWAEIAARYRGRPDAETVLTRVVIEGADPADRHWKDRVEFTAMRGNEPGISPDEARALVRWILDLRRP